MNILILYATNSGSTYEAAKVVRDTLNRHGHSAGIKSVTNAGAEDIEEHDAIVFGSCTWQWKNHEGKTIDGQLPQHFHDFQKRIKGISFQGKRIAVYGLGDSSYADYCAAADHLALFVKDNGGELVHLRVIAGALQ